MIDSGSQLVDIVDNCHYFDCIMGPFYFVPLLMDKKQVLLSPMYIVQGLTKDLKISNESPFFTFLYYHKKLSFKSFDFVLIK